MCRLDEISGPLQRFAAAQQFPALGCAAAMAAEIARHRAGIDQRPHERVGIERIADAHLAVRGDQPPFEFGGTRAMHQHAPRGGAALAGGSHRAEDDRRHREIEIGGFIDDDGVVAAELEQTLAEPLGDPHADLPSHMRRAGERDQGDAPVIDESAGEFGARVDEDLEYRRGASAVPARGCRYAARRVRTARSSAMVSKPWHCR